MKTFTSPRGSGDLVALRQRLSKVGFDVLNVGGDKTRAYVYLADSEQKHPGTILQEWLGVTAVSPQKAQTQPAIPSSSPKVRAPSIPRVFHRIWLGSKPLPERFREFGETWKQLHPTWELMLWTDQNRPKLRYEHEYWATTNWSNRSNLLRYELILDHGGVYLDTDFECFKPIDSLIEGLEFFTACEHYPEGWIAPGLFGAVPGHPIVKEVVDGIATNPESVSYEKYCATEYFTSIVKKHPEAKIFPPELFYPYYCNETYRGRDNYPKAYAAHHWAMSWRSNSL